MEEEKMTGGESEHQQQQEVEFSLFREWQKVVLVEVLCIPPLMIHVALVLLVGWICSRWKCNLLFVFTVGFAYICYIENRQRQKIEARIRSDERKSTDRKRLLSDAETARWLNSVVKTMWPIFLEKFASGDFLMRLAPWFLEKYKPWTAKKVVLQKLYLGKNPPVFTLFRAGRNPTDGDHLVLEMAMNFSSSKDMQAALAVQMRKRLGFGIWTSIHISNIQIEGNLKVGIRFTKGWPMVERLRISFANAPIIRMVATPVFSHGVDVTDLPGIAAWLDKMIVDALEQSLVEPNLLVVDVPKLVGEFLDVYAKLKSVENVDCSAGDWFHGGKMGSVGTLLVEILEGESMKPCDTNGKADPYVKISLGQAEAVTTIRRKTLQPKWHETFRIPVVNWDSLLKLRVRDKDRFLDDEMGYKHIDIEEFRDGLRHEMWLQLDGVKTGRLHVALTVEEVKSMDDKESKCSDADSIKDAMSTTPAGSLREEQDHYYNRSKSGSSAESWGSESDETPLRDESENVDIGIGQSGCVSIVNPGREVVKEAKSVECLRQQNRSRRARSQREKEPGKSQRQEDESDDVQQDLSNQASGHGVKKSKGTGLLRRKSNEDKKDNSGHELGGELLPETNELEIYNVGDTGSRVQMKLQLDDEDVKKLEACGLQDELPLVPECHEIEGERVDDCEEHEKHRRSRIMKQMGKGVLKQAGKTVHDIGHVFSRSNTH
ncbi:unnamed protein product [Calypogeia fissa]